MATTLITFVERLTSAPCVALVPLLAVALDFWLGEPRRWHPLVGFGCLAAALELRLNCAPGSRWRGVVAWLALILIPVGSAFMLELFLQSLNGLWGVVYPVIAALVLYWAIGWKSLIEHVFAVEQALVADDLPLARQQVARIVSRDCQSASSLDVRRAAIESALENTGDAMVGPIFWFVLAGIPGVVLYRLSNTLDAMWGYRNPRYNYFGWAAARIDDVLSFIPARLTALGFILFGASRGAWSSWRRDASRCASPNAGPVICAGAGALGLRLGGPCRYHGELHSKPWLGGLQDPQTGDICASLRLLNRCVGFWVVVGVAGLAWLGNPLVNVLWKGINAD